MRGDKKAAPGSPVSWRSGLPAALAAGAVIAAAVCALNVGRGYGWSRSVCDGLFVASVMLLGMGGIRAVGNRGAFDVAGYGLHMVLEMAMPFLKRTEDREHGVEGHSGEQEDIHQYRARREAQRKSPAGLLLAGGVYFILSLAALAVYEFF